MIARTRFKKEIISEFLPPTRPSKRVLIFCYGMPGVPKKKEALEYWSRQGFWTFLPRYRGTWESDGKFLKESPEKDIRDVIEGIMSGWKDLWTGKKYRLRSPEIFVLGGSFGGPAAILLSRDPRVKKAVAISPVIDWRVDSTEEPMTKLGKFTREGFGNGYRFSMENWKRLARGEFYNPVDEAESIVGEKLLLVHAKDDPVCPYRLTKKFAEKTGAKLISLPRGGHIGISESTTLPLRKHIHLFLR